MSSFASMTGLVHVVAFAPTITSASGGDVRTARRGMALMRSNVLLVECLGPSSSSSQKRTGAAATSQSCWAMTSSNHICSRSREARAMQLTSISRSQHVVNSSTSSARLAAPVTTTAHSGLLLERISSSLFCSCSGSSPVPSGSGSAGLTNGQRFKQILGGRSSGGSISSSKGIARRSIYTAAAVEGFKQTHVSQAEMGSSRTRRRMESTPLVPSAFGRGQSQPASENWDVGDLRLDTNTGLDEMGSDGSFGDGATGEDDLELTGFVATKLDDEHDDDNLPSHNNTLAHGGDLQRDTRESVSGSESESDSSPSPWLSKRWGIVILCFFAFLLCNMDRVNMSIAIMPMSVEYNWNPTTVGLVQSSFFWGYLLTQVAGGIWADSIGGKQVLGFGVIWWSLATIATPIAAKIGLPALFFVRACMGIGEGVAMPAMNNLLSKWIPVGERSRSLALVYSGMYLGSVTGLACSPSLIHRFGWPSVFFSFGSIGAIWFALWQKFAYSSPAEDPTLGDAERALILKSNKPREPITTIPWGLLLSKAPVWALIICHFCHNWGTFILLTWMPTYYNQVLGFNLMESGLLSVLPWLTMAISANVGGYIADLLVSKGYTVTFVRKVMQSIGFLGPAFFLTQLSHIRSPYMAVACMMASQGSDAFSQSGLYSNHQDIGPRYSGILLGLSNTAGVLAGVFGTAATGYILQHGSWDDVFKVAVGLYLFGTVVWNLFATGEQLFD